MDTTLIIVLAIILLILIILNNITVVTTTTTTIPEAVCSQTTFGCCPNGVDSKVNFYGTNCPGYRPPPGYPIQPNYPPQPPTPVPVPAPQPNPPKPIGGCSGTQYGCCPNNYTPKINLQGSNCLLQN